MVDFRKIKNETGELASLRKTYIINDEDIENLYVNSNGQPVVKINNKYVVCTLINRDFHDSTYRHINK